MAGQQQFGHILLVRFQILSNPCIVGAAGQELDQRRTSLMLTDEEDDGAPPRSKVDLEKGTAVLRVRNQES